MKNSLLIIFSILSASIVFAQEKFYQISYTDPPGTDLQTQTGKLDSANFLLEAQRIKNQYLSEGYLLANIDKLQFKNDTLLAAINIGNQYKWLALGTENIPEEMLSRAGYRQRDFHDIEFSGRQFNRLITKLLDQAGNSGYPFANLQLQEIKVEGSNVKGVLVYDPGPKILYDSLTVYPEHFIKNKFLENYLRTREGTLFQIDHIGQIENAINRLPYCQLDDSISMGFENNLCNIGFTLKPIKANKIDALIGFLPNQKQGNGLLITGYVNLHLQNLFRSGKELSLSWRQFQQQSQKLDVLYRHPNLFNSPLGFSLQFDLLKQDSSFLNTNFNIKGYYNHNKVEVSFLADFKSSRPLGAVTDSLALPEYANYNLRQLGIRTYFYGLEERANPMKGGIAFFDFKIGNKQINKTPEISDIVYDSLNLKSLQIQLSVGGEVNQRVAGPLVVHVDASYATVLNQDVLFTNDLIRLGGVNSLRGFNEYELFVSSYGLVRIEGRLIMNNSSRLFVFFDQAITNNSISNFTDQPRGFGAGMLLDTGNGDLQLIYALGVSAQQSLSLAQSKIHIGYVARF